MFKVIRMLTILSFAFSLCGMASFALASSRPVRTLEYTFKPVEMPKKAGPVKLELAFKRKQAKSKFEKDVLDCDEVQIRIKKLHNLVYAGDTSWVMQIDSGKWYSAIFEVDIPPNDTSGIEVVVKCGRTSNPAAFYFVTTGDTIEFYKGKPSGYPPTPSAGRSNDPDRDTLTIEQLQTKYEIWVDLRDKTHLKIAKRILGQLHDSSEVTGEKGYFVLNITLDEILKLADEGIELDLLQRENPQRPSKVIPQKKKKDQSTQRTRPQQAEPLNEVGPNRELQRVPETDSDKQARIQWQLRRMHELEKTPHEGEYRHFFKVGEEIWVREPGQYKFHKSVPIKDYDARIRKRNDSIANIPLEAPHEAEMYLDDPKKLELARQKVDSLKLTPIGTYKHGLREKHLSN